MGEAMNVCRNKIDPFVKFNGIKVIAWIDHTSRKELLYVQAVGCDGVFKSVSDFIIEFINYKGVHSTALQWEDDEWLCLCGASSKPAPRVRATARFGAAAERGDTPC